MMSKVAKSFVQEFVIGFGFLNGLWIYIGIDPEATIIQALLEVANTVCPGFKFSLIVWFISTVSTIMSFLLAYNIGGKLGLIAVCCAFIGGIFIDSIGIFLLLAGIVIGLIAPHTKEN